MAIEEKDDALFCIRNNNSGEILVQITKDMKLEVNEDVAKNQLMLTFWNQIANWVPYDIAKNIETKEALIRCYSVMKDYGIKDLVKYKKSEDDGISWDAAMIGAERLFY